MGNTPNIANSNLWQASVVGGVTTSKFQDTDADIAIIGGGFTGCASALRAAELGARVCLLEADEIGSGGSGRNVGLVNAGLWLPPDTVEKQMGLVDGRKLNSALADGPGLVWSLIKKHEISCHAVRTGTLHLAHSASGLADIQDRYNQQFRRRAPVEILDATETAKRVGTGSFLGALLDRRAGTIHPLSYCRGLARAAQFAGASLHQKTPAMSVTRERDRWIIQTVKGAALTAKKLLLATNAYHRDVSGATPPNTTPVYFMQIATSPLPEHLLRNILPGKEGCWDTAPVMSAFRLDEAGRLLFGGIGQLDHAFGHIHKWWAKRKLASLFPELEEIDFEFSWHGRISMTADHIPKIVRLGKDGYSIFGYSGRGIAPGTLFGSQIANTILNGDESTLPIKPIESYQERFNWVKRPMYEIGATASHAFPL